MTTDRLFTALCRTWNRALVVSASEDLPREYVNVLLPLMPEAAGDLLRALRDSGYPEGYLLRDHAVLLGRHARDLFLDRVFTVFIPMSPVVLVAEAALGVAPEERAPFRERARSAIERETSPELRVGALLAWRAVEPEGVAERLTSEALALLPSVPIHALPGAVRAFRGRLRASQRKALLAHVESRLPETTNSSLLLAFCAISPRSKRVALANAAIALAALHERKHYWATALAALRLVSFASVRPWFERYLGELDSMRDLEFILQRVGPRLPRPLLDLAERRVNELDEEVWRRSTVLAELSRHHAARRAALRSEARALVERVVGDPVFGHRMAPGEYYKYDDIDAIRACVGMRVSAAFEGEERRDLQRRALALVERSDASVERERDFGSFPWGDLGASLDPSLHEEAARVAVSMGHRPVALKSLGVLVGALPESSRHLALLGLSRLADGAPPERLPRALRALESAVHHRAEPVARRTDADRAAVAWTVSDETSLARFKEIIAGDDWIGADKVRPVCERLTRPAARRAAAYVLSMERTRKRSNAAVALSESEPLTGTVERERLVADLLVPDERDTPFRHDVDGLARQLLALCPDGDATWSERVAVFIEGSAWNTEAFLDRIEALAPVLRRLGGAELLRRLAATLRDPPPTMELARPWGHAATGAFDA